MATKQSEEPTKATETTKETAVETNKQRSPLWWILGTVLVVLVLLFLAGAAKRAFHDESKFNDRFDRGGFGMIEGRGGRGGHMTDRLNDDTSVSGVVIKIDGSMLTVAGNGTTKQVTINDSTEYYGATQPVKVNDSVRIHGTTSNDVFTAAQIMISRQSAQ